MPSGTAMNSEWLHVYNAYLVQIVRAPGKLHRCSNYPAIQSWYERRSLIWLLRATVRIWGYVLDMYAVSSDACSKVFSCVISLQDWDRSAVLALLYSEHYYMLTHRTMCCTSMCMCAYLCVHTITDWQGSDADRGRNYSIPTGETEETQWSGKQSPKLSQMMWNMYIPYLFYCIGNIKSALTDWTNCKAEFTLLSTCS